MKEIIDKIEQVLKDLQENFEYSNQLADRINHIADIQIKTLEKVKRIEEKLNIGMN